MSTRQLDHLFELQSRHGILRISDFVQNLERVPPAEETTEHEEIACELSRLKAGFAVKLPETKEQLKTLFARYDTRHRGGLTLFEWTKLVGDYIHHPEIPVRDIERVHKHFTQDSGEFTFEDFLICVKVPRCACPLHSPLPCQLQKGCGPLLLLADAKSLVGGRTSCGIDSQSQA